MQNSLEKCRSKVDIINRKYENLEFFSAGRTEFGFW